MENNSDNNEYDSKIKNEYFSELPIIPSIQNSKKDQNIPQTDFEKLTIKHSLSQNKDNENLQTNDSEKSSFTKNNDADIGQQDEDHDQIFTEFKTEIYQNYNVIPENTNGFCIPSLKQSVPPDTVFDSVLIHKAVHFHVFDKETIKNILAKRTSIQRDIIQEEYEKNYSQSLIDSIKSKTKDPYERVLVSMLYHGSDLDAYLIHKASKGLGTDDSIYRFILCTRSHEQICLIKESYQKIYKQSLESLFRSETSGSFQEMMLELINESRIKSQNIDISQIIQDVVELLATSSFEFAAPNSLMHIFCRRSYSNLLRTFYEYNKKTGHSVNKYLKKFIPSNYQKCLISIYHFIKNPIRFYTKYLKEGIHKKSIYHITSVVVSRCEIDLINILDDYMRKYNTDFLIDIKSIFISHEYKDILDIICILCGQY